MFSVITNIYNKKTKGPILMELFTATGKLKKGFFWQLEMFDVCTMGDMAHIDTIFKLARTSHLGASALFPSILSPYYSFRERGQVQFFNSWFFLRRFNCLYLYVVLYVGNNVEGSDSGIIEGDIIVSAKRDKQ
jgi:hypothetical protein